MSKTLQDWLDWQETLHPSEIDLGLERVARVLYRLLPECISADSCFSEAKLLGPVLPETVLPEKSKFSLPYKIITIAGTNGKGSTVTMLEAIFTEAGYRVGSYTSPHLLQYNERVKIDQIPVIDEFLCDSFARIDQAREALSLTYFEFGTLAAIDIFYQQSCEIVILEVGLGGRLDAVNVVDPDIAMVTTVDIDHQDWLGSDRNAIGIEKAGIYRSNKPAIYGDIDCPQSIRDIIFQQKLNFFQYSVDYQYHQTESHWDWLAIEKNEQLLSHYNLPLPRLKGTAQLKNAANVLLVLELLKDVCPVTRTHIICGLQKAQLAGRFQVFSTDPFILLDVAHNVQAAKVLRSSINELKAVNKTPLKAFNKTQLKVVNKIPLKAFGKLHVIVGMLKDKDVLDVLSILAPIVDSWRIIELDTPRAMPAEDMAVILKNDIPLPDGVDKKVHCFSNFKQAYHDYTEKEALLNSIDKLLVFGSFFTVTDALSFLKFSDIKTAHE